MNRKDTAISLIDEVLSSCTEEDIIEKLGQVKALLMPSGKKSGRVPNNFFWQDKSGRDYNNNFNQTEIKSAFVGERNYDGQAVSTWSVKADVGDTWRNNANEIIRTQFLCICGADKPEDVKYYDGAVGYEALICKRCGRMYDHLGQHEADDFSCSYVGIPEEQAKQYSTETLIAERQNLLYALEAFKEVVENDIQYLSGKGEKVMGLALIAQRIKDLITPAINNAK